MRPSSEQRLYERLTSLPLFQGMSRSDIEQIIAKTRFGFSRESKNRVVKREGDACDSLVFLLQGEITSLSVAADHGYSVEETLSAPCILQPDRIFGLTQRYTRTFTTATACEFLELEKPEVVSLTDQYIIFRLNLLNTIATLAQRLSRQPWHPADTFRGRLVRFFADRCSRPAGRKVFRIKMVRLAQELGVSRGDVSQVLNQLQDEGLLDFSRGIIQIPKMEAMVNS